MSKANPRRLPTKLIGILFSLMLALTLSVSAQGQERERLRISTLFIGSSLLPLWIAQDQGYFNQRGLNVELIWMQSTLSTSALLAGEVDAVFGTPQSIFAALNTKTPPPLITIGAWGSASEHYLVVNPSIKSVKDLEGKIVATSRPKSADDGYLKVIFERAGADIKKVTLLSAGGQGGRLAAVDSGRVAGSTFNRYYTLQLKKKGFVDIAKLERPDYPFPPSIITVRQDVLQSKRAALKAMMQAMMQATEKQKADKVLAQKLISKHMRLRDPAVVEAAYEDGVTLSYPRFTERQFQITIELMSKSLEAPVNVSYKQITDHSIVDEITGK